MLRVIPFTFEGSNYEIRVVTDGSTIWVRAFKEGKPADGYSYQVTVPNAMDLQHMEGISAIDSLINEAKRNVLEKTWENLLMELSKIAKGSNQFTP